MKNNSGKINLLGADAQHIKVNLKQKNPNINFNKAPIFPERLIYDKINPNKYFIDELKNVKYQQYIDPNTYNNKSILTEYESLPKYSINPSDIYKIGNLPPKDFQMIYNNTNGNRNRNRNKEIISKNFDRQYRFNNNNDTLTNRPLERQRKTISSNRENNKLIQFKNTYNNNSTILPRATNKKTNLRIGTKLNITKSEIQYPLNYIRNIPTNKYMSYNNTDLKDEDSEEETNIKNPMKAHSKNKNNDIGRYYLSSTNNINDNSNRKTMRQNKSNFGFINRRKNINEFKSPKPIDTNHISNNKLITNYNTFSKNENDTINSYYSSYNFYHKDERGNLRKNAMNLNLHSTTNNFGYLNTISNAIEENNRINPLYANINNEEIFENDNRKTYINIVEPDFNINNRKIKKVNNINNINLNAPRHIKGKRSVDIVSKLKNNNEMKFNNILDINKFIQYKKKLLEEFCHCLEEFIFINVKNNFDSFIFKLREYSKQKYFNSLLLKRLQNKDARKNIYVERSSSSNKSLEPNPIVPYYFGGIRTHKRGEFYIPKEYIGRKISNDYSENMSDVVYDDLPRLTKNYRTGKSHGRYYINRIDNYDSNYNDYYENDSYFNNIGNVYDYENNRYRKINSIEKYKNSYNFNDNKLYVPKKFKHAINNQFSDKKNLTNNYRNIKPYYNTMNEIEKKILSPEVNDVNKSHDIDKDMIKAKIIKKNNYNMNYYKTNKNLQDISYDNNYIINKNIENGLLNSINHNNNKKAAPIEKVKTEKKNQVYKKKIQMTKIKSKIIKKKIPSNNKNKDEKLEKEEKVNSNIVQLENKNNNKLEEIKEQNLELLKVKNTNDNNKNEMKTEFNNNLNDDKKDNKASSINDNNNKIEDVENENKEKNNENGNNVIININKNIEDENNKKLNDDNNNDTNNQDKGNEISENNTYEQNNNPIDEIRMSNGNNILNEDIDESDENITREIIVKDVSTIDKRLNVFIKYIQIPDINPNKSSSNNFKNHSLILFQTDSIYLPALYQHKYNYYNYNYYYGNTNDKYNKLKLHKILSSIIEEEEKSKVAGSGNNSIISEEENCNGNYSHFYIQSIKYFTNFLQSIFDDKKKDISFKFFKILKRIKNEAFLKGLINQKKMQTLNKLKDDNDIEEENENNTSGDVILYNVNDNFNVDIDYFGSKSNDRKDISNMRNKDRKNKSKHKSSAKKNEKSKKEENCKNSENSKNHEDIKQYKKYYSSYNFHKLKEDILDINNNINLSMDLDKQEIDKKIIDFLNKDEPKSKKDKNEKLQINVNNNSDLNNNTEIKDNDLNKSEINGNYEKNVTISEACRGLSDVIFDFKIYLVKFCLKNIKSSK